jgi:hypothetical protein
MTSSLRIAHIILSFLYDWHDAIMQRIIFTKICKFGSFKVSVKSLDLTIC